MNKWIGIGRLCNDPDIRITDSGKTVANYRIAVNRDFKRDGQPDADFLNCVAFGKNGEFVEKYLHKGMKIAIDGRIQTRDYMNKDGVKVYVTEIAVDHHEFCESKAHNESAPAAAYSPSPTAKFEEMTDDDSELPF